jgi:hypothetical protein
VIAGRSRSDRGVGYGWLDVCFGWVGQCRFDLWLILIWRSAGPSGVISYLFGSDWLAPPLCAPGPLVGGH